MPGQRCCSVLQTDLAVRELHRRVMAVADAAADVADVAAAAEVCVFAGLVDLPVLCPALC